MELIQESQKIKSRGRDLTFVYPSFLLQKLHYVEFHHSIRYKKYNKELQSIQRTRRVREAFFHPLERRSDHKWLQNLPNPNGLVKATSWTLLEVAQN
jgi:hypothetical protein